MPDLVGEKVVLSVAQIPFEAPSETGAVNLFCTLAPVFLEEGGIASELHLPYGFLARGPAVGSRLGTEMEAAMAF